jgi:hypothetical protein
VSEVSHSWCGASIRSPQGDSPGWRKPLTGRLLTGIGGLTTGLVAVAVLGNPPEQGFLDAS